MKIEKSSLIIGITIGIILSGICVYIISPFLSENTFHNKEFKGYFLEYRPVMAGNLTVDGLWFDMKNVTVTMQGISYKVTQQEFWFEDVKYPLNIIDSFIGKNITIGCTLNGYEMAKIDYIIQS